MKVYHYSIISILLFLLSPVTGFISTIFNFKRQNKNISYLIISFFIGLLIIKNPPLADAYRYLDMFDSSESNIYYFSNYITFYWISYLFKILGFDFYWIPFFYVFFTVFFILKALDLVYVEYGYSYIYHILIILSLIILINPVVVSSGMRNSLAGSIYIYGVILFYLKNVKTGFFWILFSILIHFSYVIMVFAFILTLFFKLNRFYVFFLCLIGFFLSSLVFNYFFSVQLINDELQSHYSGYENFTSNKSQSFITQLSNYIGIFFKILIFFIIVKSLDIKNKLYFLMNLSCWLVIMASFLFVNPVSFGRLLILANLILFICVYLDYIVFNPNVYIKIFLIIVVVFSLIVFDIIQMRHQILNGGFFNSIIYSPFNLFFYSDYEYRKFLSNIDNDGSWIY